MLKRFLILVTGLFCISGLYAQESFKPSAHFGIHGGVNYSRVAFKPRLNESLIRSNVFGLVFRYVSEPNIGLQVEVNVAGKGWKEVIDSAGTYTRKLNTVDIPVLAAFVAGKRTVRLAFTIGPYVSYLRNEKELILVADTLYKPYYQKPLIHKLEFGFTGGVALEFYTKLGTFALRGSYNHSLTNLFPLDIKEFYFSGSRNQVIQAGLMYFVNF